MFCPEPELSINKSRKVLNLTWKKIPSISRFDIDLEENSSASIISLADTDQSPF